MRTTFLVLLSLLVLAVVMFSCEGGKECDMEFTGAKNEVKLMTINPGHFHAALVQKKMYKQVDPLVHVYAPEGPDVDDHLQRINNFNTRQENPTSWETEVYVGDDFLQKMISEKPGNVMVTAGNNRDKINYINAAVENCINVLADKPMVINKDGFEILKRSFDVAQEKGVLLYDIMTERYEITTILQRELANNKAVFGELVPGTPEKPSVTKESVHHFFKYVAGNPIKRPPWYFDTSQQGEGIVDVSTHLVDLIQWECFPGEILDYQTDIEMLSAERFPTELTQEQFTKVTRSEEFPEYLQENINDQGNLEVYSNGAFTYKLKDVTAKVSVIWRFQAPEGTGDTHYSIMRGTKSNVIIEQGEDQNYTPELYVEAVEDAETLENRLDEAIATIQGSYPGVDLEKQGDLWHIIIPDKYRVGHEAHFGQVTEKYLGFLVDGKLPDWEVPNMLAKYYTTTSALALAMKSSE